MQIKLIFIFSKVLHINLVLKVIDFGTRNWPIGFPKAWGAYHLTEKSGWGLESIMVSDLPVYRRNATSVTA